MRLGTADLEWLALSFPSLLYDAATDEIAGDLAFCAAYDSSLKRVRIGDDAANQRLDSFLCDSFSLRIDLDAIDKSGWPRVYGIGGRIAEISSKHNVDAIDLHFYPDGSCCLGIRFSPERHLTAERFVDELVIPFFYRLSYVDKHGLLAASRDLWGEYAHGEGGFREYMNEILSMAARNPGRNELCPCGSGRKYKRCHLDDVAVLKDAQAHRRR